VAQRIAAAQYEASVRSINEWHRISPFKHPYERYQEEAQLEPILAERQAALAEFGAGINAREYLLEHGLTPDELERVRQKLRD
jgi:hypothetical protein